MFKKRRGLFLHNARVLSSSLIIYMTTWEKLHNKIYYNGPQPFQGYFPSWPNNFFFFFHQKKQTKKPTTELDIGFWMVGLLKFEIQFGMLQLWWWRELPKWLKMTVLLTSPPKKKDRIGENMCTKEGNKDKVVLQHKIF